MTLNEIIAAARYAADRINRTQKAVTMTVNRINNGCVQLRTIIGGTGETDRTNLRVREADRFTLYKILSCYQCAKIRGRYSNINV